jgi:hypothetical protein
MMDQAAIFLPMCALAGLTFAVLLLVPVVRFRERVPGTVSLPNGNLMNLVELPLLFYVVCIGLYITLSVDALAVALAWLYFGLRLVHSLVHLTYNNVFHRLGAFAASAVVLGALWVRFGVALLQR